MRPLRHIVISAWTLLALSIPALAHGAEPWRDVIPDRIADTLDVVEVTALSDRSSVRIASATQGSISAAQLRARRLQRTGDVLETVPGVMVSQHSGEGKANQYYLRGFNLDHGTDFATHVAGMPVNMPSHAHGQGYTDLNFVIPELVEGIQYRKGVYYAEEGDFSAAGGAHMAYRTRLAAPLLDLGLDGDGYRRVLLAGSRPLLRGHLLGALEGLRNDGPWLRRDDFRRGNAVLRWTASHPSGSLSLTAMGYRGRWNATDQVPQRAVASGTIARYGFVDSTDGGASERYSLSGEWQRASVRSATRISGHAIRYKMNLFSNFTYFLDDPESGDQFEQADDRWVAGLRVVRQQGTRWAGREVLWSAGLQARHDDVATVGLYRTTARSRRSTTREDAVRQSSLSPWAQADWEAAPWLRLGSGLRADAYRFSVRSALAANSGVRTAGLVSPKASVVVGPFGRTVLFANLGTGFHSNDARGVTLTVDPVTGEPAQRVDPLVRARGADVGLRTTALARHQSSVALWRLDLDSELLFVGDAGSTTASRPSRRQGLEITHQWTPAANVAFDASVGWSQARFRDEATEGRLIPGAVERVVAAGMSVADGSPLHGGLRVRHFGARPLVEDGSVRSRAATTLSGDLGWRFTPGLRLVAEAFNLLGSRASDVDYYYRSRLQGEPEAGVEDLHTHPLPPFTLRVTATASF